MSKKIRRNSKNNFLPDEGSEYIPEKDWFIGEIDILYKSDDDAYERIMRMEQSNKLL